MKFINGRQKGLAENEARVELWGLRPRCVPSYNHAHAHTRAHTKHNRRM
jgi:hypothetical protein